jgi:hypothetical protein
MMAADRTAHGEARYREAKAGDSKREVGDANHVIRDGRQFTDTETGTTVHVQGNRVVVTNKDGAIVTVMKLTKKNIAMRIQSGRWVLVPR